MPPRSSSRTGICAPRCKASSSSSRASISGKHGRARERWRTSMTPLRVGVVGVGHLGQHHARILAAMPGVELVAVADARPEQAQAVAARCGTTSPWPTTGAARAGRRRHDRRAHRACIAKSPARSWRGASPRWSRSRWPAPAAEAEQLVAAGQAPAAPSCRSATSSGSTRLCWPSSSCRSAPSTSPPSGSRPTRSARPTSASCST